MSSTKIEWADAAWNPVTGCTKVSAGCANCYAEGMARRFGRHGSRAGNDADFTTDFSRVLVHMDRLDQPLHWRKPRRVFVCSMGDLFHEDVPNSFRDYVWNVMQDCPQHTFMVLTKRPGTMLAESRVLARERTPLSNVWLGVSVENQAAADERIPLLLQTPAAVRFVSVEPMLGPVALWAINDGSWYDREGATRYNALTGAPWWGGTGDHGFPGGPRLDWVICGGETGPKARGMETMWARLLRYQCEDARIPFFFKHHGTWHDRRQHQNSSNRGRLLDGREWNEFPK